MSKYHEGFTDGYDEVLGIALRPMYSPYPEDSVEHDQYISGYYDGYSAGFNAVKTPN